MKYQIKIKLVAVVELDSDSDAPQRAAMVHPHQFVNDMLANVPSLKGGIVDLDTSTLEVGWTAKTQRDLLRRK